MPQFVLKSTSFMVIGSAVVIAAQGKPGFAFGYLLSAGLAYLLHKLTHA
jgi:hypothetical protein